MSALEGKRVVLELADGTTAVGVWDYEADGSTYLEGGREYPTAEVVGVEPFQLPQDFGDPERLW